MKLRHILRCCMSLGLVLLTSMVVAQVGAQTTVQADAQKASQVAHQPRVAAVELHNRSEIFLPRVGSYSETALIEHFRGISEAQFVDRTTVSDMLIQRYDRVVLFPSNPTIAAEFGNDLGVDYVITGNILDYESDASAHRMMVEFVVVDVLSQRDLLRKVYDGEYHDAAPTKRHREILDQIIEDMALDFKALVKRQNSKIEL